MGIFDALNTAVGGLQAQSFALQNVSGNIANSSTTGFKGINTSFEDLIPDATTPDRQNAGGVTAHARQTITSQGSVSATTVATNLAINGDGFFSVQKPTGITDNVPNFNGVVDYTRRGDFQLNANGNLVNGAGYFLQGVAVDPRTGNPLGNAPQVLQFQNNFIPARATSAIQYAANLPTIPTTTGSASAPVGTIAAAGGLNPADFSAGHSPLLFLNASATGNAVVNKAGTAITGATLLSGGAGTDSLTTNFSAGPPADTITVDGQTLTFVASGATGPNQINVTDSVGTLLSKIDALTGVTGTATASSVGTGAAAGKISLSTGTFFDLNITSSNAAAFAALGFPVAGPLPVTQARAANPNPDVVANDVGTFDNESISGGAVTAFNAAGTQVNLQLRWAKVDSSTLGGAHKDTWNLFYQADTTATTTQPEWVNAGTNFVFNANGSLVSPTGTAVTIPNVSVNNVSLGNVSFNLATGSLTQFASPSGTATINNITQDGFAAGQLQSVAINNSGLVVGTFSNGQNIDLASVTLSHFNGTNFLKALDGGAYAPTDQSGAAIIGASGTISGSALEGSNTDIADEFTKLIVTQQAYSANTKVITTSNQIIQSLLAVIQ
jgi:flagellar hook protein FlgE